MPFVRSEREAVQNPPVPEPQLPAPASPVASVLGLQRTLGNSTVARLAASGALLQRQATAERELDKKWTVAPGDVDKATADKLLTSKRIALTFFVRYVGGKKPKNDEQFVSAAADFAKSYGTLGFGGDEKSGGKLIFGRAIEVASRGDVTQAITSVHQTVHQLASARPAPEEGKPAPAEPPQVETISVFAHGEPFGIGIDPHNTNYTQAADLKSFIGAIRPHVAHNVRFLLFACSAGGESPEKEDKADPKAPGGGGSFAQLLAKELGGEAQVFAHNILGHTESNPLARMFTADSAEGRSMFEVLYGAPFADSEVTRLRAAKKDLVESSTTRRSPRASNRPCGRTTSTRWRPTSTAGTRATATSPPAAMGASERRCSWTPTGPGSCCARTSRRPGSTTRRSRGTSSATRARSARATSFDPVSTSRGDRTHGVRCCLRRLEVTVSRTLSPTL